MVFHPSPQTLAETQAKPMLSRTLFNRLDCLGICLVDARFWESLLYILFRKIINRRNVAE